MSLAKTSTQKSKSNDETLFFATNQYLKLIFQCLANAMLLTMPRRRKVGSAKVEHPCMSNLEVSDFWVWCAGRTKRFSDIHNREAETVRMAHPKVLVFSR